MSDEKPPFMVDYRHQGRDYCLTLWAEDWADAEARIRSIAATGQVVGSNVQTIRANAVTLPFVHAWVVVSCWFRNLWHRL